MTIQAMFDEGITNELLGMGFPEPQEMDFIEVNDPNLFFLGFLWKLPPGTVTLFNGLDILFGCRKVVSARCIECMSARPVNLFFEQDHLMDVEVEFWDTDGPLPSRDIVLAHVLNKILTLTGKAD
jgi:hypothetical protein